MKNKITIFLILLSLIGIIANTSCKKKSNEEVQPNKVDVIFNNIPYPTEKYVRIGYTLRMWEYEKEGLVLDKIVVLDGNTKGELMTIGKDELPLIYKDPLTPDPFFAVNKLTHYYLSIQLPIPLGEEIPATVSHQFVFMDTIANQSVTIEGGVFSPRKNETPVAISSPVKGSNWLFINQSTYDYHFYKMLFFEGQIYRSEIYAFDNLQLNDDLSEYFEGNPKVNESYFNYRDTLYAVGDGTIISLVDGLPENDGDSATVVFNTFLEQAGNYLSLDIGGGFVASYMHIVPNSFFVSLGDVVKEGDPLALLGNSGHSTGPHLHFQVCQGPDIIRSEGVPFVLKKYTKTFEFPAGPIQNTVIYNAMMEEFAIIMFD
ncbi:MAG: M23 family metallopeptidase [Bacteroidales bacterium]|nr:M23 family metallopeptidase [Bacteroidales bacterium]